LSEHKEINLAIILCPESYDYNQGDIVYRILANDQLIIERHPTVLSPHSNQMIVEKIVLSYAITNRFVITIKNLKDKKIKVPRYFINGKRYINDGTNFFKTVHPDWRLRIFIS